MTTFLIILTTISLMAIALLFGPIAFLKTSFFLLCAIPLLFCFVIVTTVMVDENR
jgi:hypothetical protein